MCPFIGENPRWPLAEQEEQIITRVQSLLNTRPNFFRFCEICSAFISTIIIINKLYLYKDITYRSDIKGV